MNRLWIGVAILLLFLIAGGAIWWGSHLFFGSFSRDMEMAGRAAVEENWTVAAEKAEKCRQKWERQRYFWAAFTDHAPMEQMQTLFSQLELYEQQRLTTEFAACCRSLSQEAEAVGDTHGLAWWSVL